MTNSEAVKALCVSIASPFYPDELAIRFALAHFSLGAEDSCDMKNPDIFRCAVMLVMGFIENSRSENGVSVSVRYDAIRNSLNYWCKVYGLDPEVELKEGTSSISNKSSLW